MDETEAAAAPDAVPAPDGPSPDIELEAESDERGPLAPFLIAMFVILLLAMVLIAANSPGFGGGCGGG